MRQWTARLTLAMLVFASALATHAGEYCLREDFIYKPESKAMLSGFHVTTTSSTSIDCNQDGKILGTYTMSKTWWYEDVNYHPLRYIECSVIEIAENAFKGQDQVKTINLADYLQTMPDGVFKDCKSLTSVNINSGNKFFKSDGNCLYRVNVATKELIWVSSAVTDFVIPADVTSVTPYTFINCKSLSNLSVDPQNRSLKMDGDFIVSYDGSKVYACLHHGSEVVLPEGVKSIPDGFMAENIFSDVTKVILPESLEKIGSYAFKGCTSLKEIELPASVKTLDTYAFSRSMLEKIVFRGSSAVTFRDNAFADMTRLTEIVMPQSVDVLGDQLFRDCHLLQHIVLPQTVRRMGDEMFKDCIGLLTAELPQTVTSGAIGKRMFADCSKLQTVTMPTNISAIPEETFYRCSALTTFTVPQNITGISNGAFRSSGIENITMHDAVTTLGTGVFEYTQNIKTITLSNGMTQIPTRTFRGSGIREIQLPQSITEVCDSAFVDCKHICKVTLQEGVTTLGEAVFKNTYPLRSIHIPTSLREIGKSAFESASLLQEITGCEGLERIGKRAFYGCTFTTFPFCSNLKEIAEYGFALCRKLTEANLPENCKLGIYTFQQTSSLKQFRIPWGIERVPAGLLKDSGIETVIISQNCKSIEYSAFETSTLRTVYCNAIVPDISSSTFHKDTYNFGTLRVPVGSKNRFAQDDYWGKFLEIVEDASGVEDVSGDDEGVQISVAGGELTVSGCASVEVYAANGLRVYAGAPGSIGSLPAGLYIVRAGGRTAKVRL
mgnify:FL=1